MEERWTVVEREDGVWLVLLGIGPNRVGALTVYCDAGDEPSAGVMVPLDWADLDMLIAAATAARDWLAGEGA